ncbi:MAG: chemotaxis-specific protein-glutamate methyltransferase CheB [Planctomycetota bacterium]
MRVLIVDDSAFMRKALRSALDSDPDVEVVGFARDGEQAVSMTAELKPDLVTLDVEMPGVDGLTALRRIMRDCPTRVVIISSQTPKGSQAALTAYKLGAIDVIAKDAGSSQSGDMSGAGQHLRRLIAGIRASSTSSTPASKATARSSSLERIGDAGPFSCIAVGSSTGGPPVLEKLIVAVPESLSVPMVIAQHMPVVFTASMAERFSTICARPVRHIEDGCTIDPGTVHICPGGSNTHIQRAGGILRATVNRLPEDTTYFPSVNVLFDTISKAIRGSVLGFVLTGMGEDGVIGARELVDRGGTIVAQNESSSVVYGMPRAVVDNDIASGAGDPDQLASVLARAAASARAQAA